MENALINIISYGISEGGVPALILGLAFIGWKFFGTISESNASRSINTNEMNSVLWERLKIVEQERDEYKDKYYKLLAGVDTLD